MKRVALDTNIAIELLNGNQTTVEFLSEYDLFYLPITVCGELLYGAKNSSRATENESKYQAFIDTCFVLNSSILVAEEYARIRKLLKDKGRPIPENDIWISVICLVNEIPIFTKDKHFSHVDDLEILKIQ